jgi:hypothetical protein
LKSVQNRHERAGTIAHLVINTYFRKARSGDIWAVDRLRNWASQLFREDQAYSRTNPDGISPPQGKFPPVLLHEYCCGFPDADQLFSDAESRLLQGIQAFGTSPKFERFRLEGLKDSSLVELRLSIGGLPCRVDGRLDFAFPTNEGGAVVDWKLSDPSDGGNESLQLAAYALWASQRFACEPEAITISKAYLVAEELSYFKATKSVIANARARIVQDAERMASLHDYGQRSVAKAFTACAQRNVCKLCPFNKVCPEGRTVVNA